MASGDHSMKLFWLLLLLFSFNSFASLEDAVREQVCNENGGFAQGMNDAREGKPMNQGFTRICDDKLRDQIQKSYREGFVAGIKKEDTPKTQINVNLASNASGKKVYCEV